MKKLIVILLSLTIVLGASAQYGHMRAFPRAYYSPRISIIGGYSPFYPYYNPFYNPYYAPNYGTRARPSKLGFKIEDINNDYKDRIWAAKHDTSLTRKQRRQAVRLLKHERDKAITDAKMNYFRR